MATDLMALFIALVSQHFHITGANTKANDSTLDTNLRNFTLAPFNFFSLAAANSCLFSWATILKFF